MRIELADREFAPRERAALVAVQGVETRREADQDQGVPLKSLRLRRRGRKRVHNRAREPITPLGEPGCVDAHLLEHGRQRPREVIGIGARGADKLVARAPHAHQIELRLGDAMRERIERARRIVRYARHDLARECGEPGIRRGIDTNGDA